MLLNLRDIIVSYSENTLRISYFFLTIKQFLDILFVKLKEKKKQLTAKRTLESFVYVVNSNGTPKMTTPYSLEFVNILCYTT